MAWISSLKLFFWIFYSPSITNWSNEISISTCNLALKKCRREKRNNNNNKWEFYLRGQFLFLIELFKAKLYIHVPFYILFVKNSLRKKETNKKMYIFMERKRNFKNKEN